MSSPHILICDDDPVVHESLALYFDNENFTHSDAYDGAEALNLILTTNPDLILLDIMMPEMSGIDVCKEARKTITTPIIFLSAKGDEIDRILGLELGADDYIVKPFSPREVIARIKVVLRRIGDSGDNSSILKFYDLEINVSNYVVKIKDDIIPFTPKEVEILHFLASHPGQVYNREQIITAIWGESYQGDARTVDTHIKRIRQKVNVDGARWNIQTVYGVGYKFEVL
ncbi:DNA-binding response regulator, OmpR family, contains REC and winged-helix (wHTH) domain [Ruminococcaceae bacterium YRB3002]|nr:DNA-binding response regulator, OmpR family, contains REC and winged-helix (wHTH) domain [Ruminococcaceae bacterium YRB3002]